MSTLYPLLFTPIRINTLTLKNRVIMLPMQLRLGLKNRRARAFYLERARGGVGAIILCATSVDLFLDDRAWGRVDGVRDFLEAMKGINTRIRETGAKVGIQLWHGNLFPAGDGASPLPEAERVAPSTSEQGRALDLREIQAIIEKFGKAAGAAKTAGFDFVEVHGAHGYLPCQFFSKADNRRTDAYGGTLGKRMRFGVELVERIRQEVGREYPLFYRIGAVEKRPDGITLRESRSFAVELEKAGVDCFDVSVGLPVGLLASPGKRAKMGTFVPLAQSIKKKVSVPVIAVGRIHQPALAEEVLASGLADLVGIGRQLLADPHWTRKVAEGMEEEIRACLSCNFCLKPLRSGRWDPKAAICAVNPFAGREWEMDPVSPSVL